MVVAGERKKVNGRRRWRWRWRWLEGEDEREEEEGSSRGGPLRVCGSAASLPLHTGWSIGAPGGLRAGVREFVALG
jgi:hypothetical protein